MAYTFEDLLDIIHIAVVVDWLRESDVAKMSLALSRFPASLANLVRC